MRFVLSARPNCEATILDSGEYQHFPGGCRGLAAGVILRSSHCLFCAPTVAPPCRTHTTSWTSLHDMFLFLSSPDSSQLPPSRILILVGTGKAKKGPVRVFHDLRFAIPAARGDSWGQALLFASPPRVLDSQIMILSKTSSSVSHMAYLVLLLVHVLVLFLCQCPFLLSHHPYTRLPLFLIPISNVYITLQNLFIYILTEPLFLGWRNLY